MATCICQCFYSLWATNYSSASVELPSSEPSSESATMRAHTSILLAVGILDDEATIESLWWPGFLNFDAALRKLAQSLTASKGDLKVFEVTSTVMEEEQRRMEGAVDLAISLYSNNGSRPHGHRGPYWDRREDFLDNRTCFHCGRTGHISHDCHAKKTIDGKDITSKMEKKLMKKAKKYL